MFNSRQIGNMLGFFIPVRFNLAESLRPYVGLTGGKEFLGLFQGVKQAVYLEWTTMDLLADTNTNAEGDLSTLCPWSCSSRQLE